MLRHGWPESLQPASTLVTTDRKVAVSSYKERVAPVFDTANEFTEFIIRSEDEREIMNPDWIQRHFSSNWPLPRALELIDMGISVVICGAVSKSYREAIQAYGVEIISFVSGDIDNVIKAYLDERLESPAFKMPGCNIKTEKIRRETEMNKVAFSTSGITLTAPLDQRFGRTEKILIYDMDRKTFEVIDNAVNMNAAQGAGIQTAQTVLKSGAASLVTGHCGPKAYRVLKSAGIKVYYSNESTVQEALEKFRSGLLAESSDADVEGHW